MDFSLFGLLPLPFTEGNISAIFYYATFLGTKEADGFSNIIKVITSEVSL